MLIAVTRQMGMCIALATALGLALYSESRAGLWGNDNLDGIATCNPLYWLEGFAILVALMVAVGVGIQAYARPIVRPKVRMLKFDAVIQTAKLIHRGRKRHFDGKMFLRHFKLLSPQVSAVSPRRQSTSTRTSPWYEEVSGKSVGRDWTAGPTLWLSRHFDRVGMVPSVPEWKMWVGFFVAPY